DVPGAERAEHHAAGHAGECHSLRRHLQRPHHRCPDPTRAEGCALPRARRGGCPAPPRLDLWSRRHPHSVPQHQARRHDSGRAGSGVKEPAMSHLRAALVSLVVLTVVTGIVYPVVVTASAQLVFQRLANGSLIVKDGKVIGSALIGQPFDDPKYFWGRPSATSPFGYNAASSSGSNLSPTN